MSCESRCTGGCCRYFSVGPPQLVELRLASEIAKGGEGAADAELVKSLLIYRGYFTNPINTDNEPWHWYTCKHFVVDDDYVGFCEIYENRPNMCRRYPNGSDCVVTGCTLSKDDPSARRREPLVPKEQLLWKKRHAERMADPELAKWELGQAPVSEKPTCHPLWTANIWREDGIVVDLDLPLGECDITHGRKLESLEVCSLAVGP